MRIDEVIKYPILSEKTYAKMAEGVYTFAVDFRTNKAEVKKVVEHIFDVKVEKVNIMLINKKAKSLGRFQGFTNRYKKAIVKLVDGQNINIFPEEAAQEATKEVKVKETKKAEMSEAEKKAAAKIAAKAQAKDEAVKAETKKED